MNFQRDIFEYVRTEFQMLGIEVPKGKTEDLLIKLFTIQQKFIYNVPRQVKISNELKIQISSNKKYLAELIMLKTKLELGQDVNTHQSKNLFNYHVHDHLAYSWKIYHLHLNFEKENYFTKRTKEVLFVYIDNGQALFLSIQKHPPHEIFADKLLLEIIDNNWNNVLPKLSDDVVGISNDFNAKERFQLRKHGVNEGPIEVNGRFFFSPGLGQASSGHSVDAVRKLINFNRWLNRNEKELTNNREAFDQIFVKKYNLPQPPHYKILFTVNGPEI